MSACQISVWRASGSFFVLFCGVWDLLQGGKVPVSPACFADEWWSHFFPNAGGLVFGREFTKILLWLLEKDGTSMMKWLNVSKCKIMFALALYSFSFDCCWPQDVQVFMPLSFALEDFNCRSWDWKLKQWRFGSLAAYQHSFMACCRQMCRVVGGSWNSKSNIGAVRLLEL